MLRHLVSLLLASALPFTYATYVNGQSSTGPPRDGSARNRGEPGKIVGRVVDSGTSLPLRRATVTLTQRAGRGDPRVVSTDEQGALRFVDLPLGEYVLTAVAGGYVPLGPGQRRPTDPRRPVLLSPAHASEDVTLELPRGGVITGKVFDEFGQPVLGATVRAAQLRHSRGRARAIPVGNRPQTDDLGQYRIFGLATGTYVVSADLPTAFVGRNLDESGYAPSYHPGTPLPEDARVVAVVAPSESPADVVLAPVPLCSVSGTVISRGRAVPGGRVNAVRHVGARDFVLLGMKTGRIEPDGTFSITGLVPGEYLLFASLPDEDPTFPIRAPDDMAVARVRVSEGQSTGVTLERGRYGVARGRVVIEGAARAGVPKSLRVETQAPDEHAAEIDVRPADVGADGSFELRGLFGRQLLSVDGADEARLDLKSVRVAGEDVTDTGIIFEPGQMRDGIELVLTAARTMLAGVVIDDLMRPVTAAVLLFSEDAARWTHPTDAYVRRTQADAKGAFRFHYLRPGAYLVVAVDDFDMASYGDPLVLERLRPLGTLIEVGSGEEATTRLTLQRP